MLFVFEIFREKVAELAAKDHVANVAVDDLIYDEGLCAVDVSDVGFILQDAEILDDAVSVFSLEIGQLNEMLDRFEEAA